MSTLILRSEDITRIVTVIGFDEVMDRMIERLSSGFCELGAGRSPSSPPRSGFVRVGELPGVIETMPHYRPGGGITVKLISYNPRNRQRFNLPTVLGGIVRIDEDSGMIAAIADGGLLTAVRTGAASAIASRLLAASGPVTVGVIGAGAQAVTQLQGLGAVLDLREVLVFDTDPANAASLRDRTPFLDLDMEWATPTDMLERADVICTATSVAPGAGPVLPDARHRPHLHINAVGADETGKTELPLSLLQRAFVCVDHVAQALTEGESQQLGPDEIGPSLGYLCANPDVAAARRDGLTVFDSTGFALEDHLALDVFLEMAQEIGVGEKTAILHCPDDVYNPYCPSP